MAGPDLVIESMGYLVRQLAPEGRVVHYLVAQLHCIVIPILPQDLQPVDPRQIVKWKLQLVLAKSGGSVPISCSSFAKQILW